MNSMDLKLGGKKALVFASSDGLGKAVSQTLAGEGVMVVINGRTEEALKKTANEIGAFDFLVGDLSQEGEAQRITEEAIRRLGGIDIVVTNAPGPEKGSFLEVGYGQWKEDYQGLWLSVVESLQVALPVMKKNGYGRILLITSIAGERPLRNLTTSNGLRAGLFGLAKSIAQEVAEVGITLNLLLPGYTETKRLRELNLSPETVRQMVPAGRLGNPSELADLSAFLASPKASYITGQSIAVDGGVLL